MENLSSDFVERLIDVVGANDVQFLVSLGWIDARLRRITRSVESKLIARVWCVAVVSSQRNA